MPEPSTEPVAPPSTPDDECRFARGVICEQARAAMDMAQHLDQGFTEAVDLIQRCATNGGTVLVTGLGKSGLIGAKISATLASLGIPSHAVHPTEATHGDLGRFRRSDLVVCLSHSGETDEVVNLAAILRQDQIPIIAITGRSGSNLARMANVALSTGVTREAGHPFVAPTSSTTAALILGDALALCVARRRGFSDADFARRHPGGALGGLMRGVTDVMRFTVGRNIVAVPHDIPLIEALRQSEQVGRRPGAILLVNPDDGRLSGILTDADIRRLAIEPGFRLDADLSRPVCRFMTRNPGTLPSDALVRDAVRMIREHRRDEIPIIDERGRPLGILDVQDLIALRLIES